MDAKDQKVTAAFENWQRCRAELQNQSQELQKALQNYVDGKGPLPSDVSDRVHELRKECDGLFAKVLEAMKDRAGTRGKKQGT
jgi:hypothetical protein